MTYSPLISIIIPVYNAERYLRNCLESITAQTYTDFEVLIVDDGSTDSSGAICDEFMQKDQRFRVLHKKNEGVSKARNKALELLKGEWFTFVDADDFLLENALQTYVSHISEDVDMVAAHYQKVDTDGNILKQPSVL